MCLSLCAYKSLSPTQVSSVFKVSCFFFRSFTAALIASSASMEQWSFTGGRLRCLAISSFLMLIASSTCLPLTHSVRTLLLAIAEPQPKVLKHESTIFPFLSTFICSFKTSPQAGAPTSPVPMFALSISGREEETTQDKVKSQE